MNYRPDVKLYNALTHLPPSPGPLPRPPPAANPRGIPPRHSPAALPRGTRHASRSSARALRACGAGHVAVVTGVEESLGEDFDRQQEERDEAARVQLELMENRHEAMQEEVRAAQEEAMRAKNERKGEKKRVKVLKKLDKNRERLRRKQYGKKKTEG